MQIDVNRCDDPLNVETCHPFVNKVKVTNICELLQSKNQFLTYFFDKVKPKITCPVQNGKNYVFANIPVNAKLVE